MNFQEIVENYHSDAVRSFHSYKTMTEQALDQVTNDEFFRTMDPEANSIAVIVKHIAGNLISRWTDFLVADGEKPDRNRDAEFELIGDTRESLMEFWERGWRMLFEAVEPLTAEDFSKTITIRGEPHTIAEALNRQMTHYAYHIGQIVFLAKHFRIADWETLSVPRNRSAEFNRLLDAKQKAGESKTNRFDVPAAFANTDQQKSGPE